MKIPSKQHLLTEVVGHAERVRRVALLGRDAAGTVELNNLLEQLQRGDSYEQMLCLFASIAARDSTRILTALQSDSVLLRNYAAAACWAVPDDEALAAVVLKVAPDTRQRLIKAIAQQRRTELAERLLPQIRANFGNKLAILLLPACTPATLDQVLAEDSHLIHNWRLLAWRYPDILIRHLQQTFETAPRRSYHSLWLRFDTAWVPLALQQPEKVVEFIGAFLDLSSVLGIPSKLLEILTKRVPEAIFTLLTRADFREKLRRRGLPRAVLKHFRLFSPEQQVSLLQPLVEQPEHVALALAQLPPSVRAARFAAAYSEIDTQHTLWPDELLDVLPHAERSKLAQQMLTRREIRENPQRQLAMTAYDDIDNARPVLEQAASAALADERADALALLVNCTARYRRGLSKTLTFLQRLKNEQDPVRNVVWEALEKVPPRLFQAEHVTLLTQMVDFSIEARDSSYATLTLIGNLAFRLLSVTVPKSELFSFSLDTLCKIAQHDTYSIRLPSLSKNLPRGTEKAIVEGFIPLIRAFEKYEQHNLLLALAQALDKRGWEMVTLQSLLETVINAKPDYLARQAISLWLAAPKTRDTRVRQLLDSDPSVITHDSVFQHLHRRRQEWLDPFLTGKPIKGQFLTGKTFYLLPASNGFHRWLPRQQQAFTKWLHTVAKDNKQEVDKRVQAIHTLAQIPTSDTATFATYLKSEEVAIIEAALGALSWIDRPSAALPILLQYLDSDRARVAMYAVPRCARLVEPAYLVTVLKELLSRDHMRVTVHKEAIRLLGTYATSASLPLLRTQWQRPSIHRDVQIAIGHAARNLLNHEEAWLLLEKMAQSEDIDITRSLCTEQPSALAETARVRYARLLVKLTQHTEVQVRREAFIALKAWTVGAEAEIAAAAVSRIIDLENSPEWKSALEVLLTCCRDGAVTERLHEVVQALINAPITDDVNAMPERDLPARQRLFQLCQGLCHFPESNRLLLRATLDSLASLYLQDASLWPQAALLYVAGLTWAKLTPAADRLISLAREVDNQPIFVQALREAVRERLPHSENPLDMTSALELIDTLVAAQSNTSALLALEILRYMGQRSDWRQEYAQRLRTLRQHQDVGIRAVACETWTCLR
ncbi:MAG: HEAT repeat domain-containing protein [Pseudomonadota bacterium]